MAVFKCKMCGGALEINSESGVAVCEYCGSVQTLPKRNDEVIANLFNRANNLRIKCEFDKAAQVYEKILNEDNSDAEAHWGLLLCKYGIEYVEDPKTYKRIPTCHRTQYESVLSDVDYLSALANSDGEAKNVYKTQAEEISELQKNILAIVKNEKPFDVFICYKETDENGKRTVDSALANDIYYQLTQEGLKVFYAAITLEDKLGQEYEPYIFAALNSAKVMLVVGTKPEYFDSVWVRNEWSRYLKLMKTDRSRLLIPCYRDMDAYDLPEEFAHLQAQDMSKIGFVNDVVRGIKKVVDQPNDKESGNETAVKSSGSNTTSLLKRAFMFLEDGDWQSADEYCEKVLDLDPECARAYLGKLMAELEVRKQEQLGNQKHELRCNINYQKAWRFADDELKSALDDYAKNVIYLKAQRTMTVAKEESNFKSAASIFARVKGYKDADSKKSECLEKAEVCRLDAKYQQALKAMKSATSESNFKTAASLFSEIKGYKDADLKKMECLEKAEACRKDTIYSRALKSMKNDTNFYYNSAISDFEKITGWKDSDEQIVQCKRRIEEIKAKEEAERLEEERIRQEALIKAEKRKKLFKKRVAIATPIAAVLVVFVIVLNMVIIPTQKRNKAMELMKAEEYDSAYALLNEIGENEVIGKSKYERAISYIDSGDYKAAIKLLYGLNYKDSNEKLVSTYKSFFDNNGDIIREYVSAGGHHTVGLKADGTVVAVGDNKDNQCDVEGWNGIVAVSAGYGHTVGLKSDGTVVAVGRNGDGQCDVEGWTDIVAVSAGGLHTVGLKSDGTVVAVGKNEDNQCDVEDWTDIVAVSAGYDHTVGLKADGTVVAVGDNGRNECDVEGWTDIIAVSAGQFHTVGLKADGTVVAVGSNSEHQCDVEDWTDIVAVSARDLHTVGLKSDGSVVAVGYNHNGQRNVEDWTDIVAVSTGNRYTIGLKSDGTVVAVGENYDKRCNVEDWNNIKTPKSDTN